MSGTEGDRRSAVPLRLALATTSLLFAFGLAEGVVRVVDRGALPQLAAYADAPDGRIVLAADSTTRVRRPDGQTWTARTGALGLREDGRAGFAGRCLLVGDSQAFGSGVEGDQTFAAQLGYANAGVPGYGLLDALDQAEALLPVFHPPAVVVLVDEANDWDDGLARAADRYRVRGGLLLTTQTASTPAARLWSTPLAHLHLFWLAWARLYGHPETPSAAPAFLASPSTLAPVTDGFAREIRRFAEAHADVHTLVVWLPVDAATSPENAARSPFAIGDATPWRTPALRDAFAAALGDIPLRDLTPVLTGPGVFLPRDFHLSVAGHAAVASELGLGRTGCPSVGLPVDSDPT